MKKIIIIVLSFIAFVFIALLTIPVFFKGDIVKLIEKQAAANMKAELHIGDMSLSMFKSFPNLNVSLKDICISHNQANGCDTLANIPLLEASVNLKSLIGGDKIIVNRILLMDGRLTAKVDTAGIANWDIFPSAEATSENEDETKQVEKTNDEKGLELNNIAVGNLFVAYNDFQNSTYASIDRIDMQLAGDFSASNTLAQLSLALKGISFRQQNSVWVNNTNIIWQTEIASDFKNNTFEIMKNDLRLNDLQLNLVGKVAAIENRYRVNLQLNAPDTKFESLLSLLPPHILAEMKDIQTSGDFKLNVVANGDYYENNIPQLDALLVINNASVKYPQLPESIQKINLDLHITNPGGSIDSTRIDLNKASFVIANNPFNVFLNILNPNNPLLEGGAKGTINFANLKKAIPLQDITIEGILETDMTFKGKYEYIEKEQYEKFTAKGNLSFQNIRLINNQFPEGIFIPEGSLTVTPAYLKLNSLKGNIYSSDFALQGKISNYLPYIFRNETLQGDFTLNSNLLNINEFILAQIKNTQTDSTNNIPKDNTANGPTAAEGALEVPRNIDAHLSTNINTIIFDNLNIKNVKGKVNLANAVANLNNLSMDMLNGTMVMNGKYNTANPQKPTVDFDLKITNFDIHEAYQAFTFIRKSIPVTMNCEGKISAAMTFAATLDKEMSPIMNTANGKGYLESQGVLINNNPAMNQLANVLKNEELSRLSISHLKINFNLENGNIVVEPFKTTFAGNPVTIYGKQSVEGNLDYTLSMTIDRKFFGNDINNMLKAIPGSDNIKTIDLDAKVGGTLTEPKIKPDLTKAIKSVTKEAEKALKGNVLKGLQNLFKKK